MRISAPVPHLLQIFAALGILITQSFAELDLTPLQTTVGNGLIHRVHFKDGDKKFAITINAQTQVSANNGGAVFSFKNLPLASATLRSSPAEKFVPFDEKTLPEYLRLAQSLLPSGASSIVLDSQDTGIFPINGWQSARFIFSYSLAGSSMKESITFITLDKKQQILIQAGSKAQSFGMLGEIVDGQMKTWHEVLPGDETGEN